MPYRYTPEEAALMQQRVDANLANFQRNSGRGLPKDTLKEMEEAAGVKLDAHGHPVPTPADGVALTSIAHPRGKRLGRKRPALSKDAIVTESVSKAEFKRRLAAGRKHPLSSLAISHPYPDAPRANAPAIARYRKRAECDGILFDSMLEMRRYKELKLLVAAKKIRYFLRQVPFHLPGDIVYRVDFMVVHYLTKSCTDKNPMGICRIEYEDCKAKPHKRSNDHDRVSLNKRKQVKALYGVEIKLIHKARG